MSIQKYIHNSFFFFNYTTTTEIYTYCPTLSLPDALPIRHRRSFRTRARLVHLRRRRPDEPLRRQRGRAQNADPVPDPLGDQEIGRAHVELQSLMRISYAVFCLKKKKEKNIYYRNLLLTKQSTSNE